MQSINLLIIACTCAIPFPLFAMKYDTFTTFQAANFIDHTHKVKLKDYREIYDKLNVLGPIKKDKLDFSDKTISTLLHQDPKQFETIEDSFLALASDNYFYLLLTTYLKDYPKQQTSETRNLEKYYPIIALEKFESYTDQALKLYYETLSSPLNDWHDQIKLLENASSSILANCIRYLLIAVTIAPTLSRLSSLKNSRVNIVPTLESAYSDEALATIKAKALKDFTHECLAKLPKGMTQPSNKKTSEETIEIIVE